MKKRKKIAIYLDYALRLPSFKKTYEIFKNNLYADTSDIELPEDVLENDLRFYWQKQLEDPKVEKFYLSKQPSKIIDEDMKGDFSTYFYNSEHLNKFLEEFVYNLYSDADLIYPLDGHILNITQQQLFDVVLIDVITAPRKKTSALYFIARAKLLPKEIRFLNPNEKLNKKEFIAVWNPLENPEQVNKFGEEIFFDWVKELEKKHTIKVNESTNGIEQ